MYYGGLDISGLAFGDKQVSIAYLGLNEVYSAGLPVGLTVKPVSAVFHIRGGVQKINIASESAWVAESNADWITLSETSGEAGRSKIVATIAAITDGEERSGIITVSTTDGAHTSTVTISQDTITAEYHKWLYPVGGFGWHETNRINTGIQATSDMEIRVKYKGANVPGSDRIAGYTWQEQNAEGVPQNNGWRFFNAVGYLMYDMNGLRLDNGNIHTCQEGVEYDISFGDYWLRDNKTGEMLLEGTPQGTVENGLTVRVDAGSFYLHSLEIKKSGVVVFNGIAATYEGKIGLFDDISGKLFEAENVTLTYED